MIVSVKSEMSYMRRMFVTGMTSFGRERIIQLALVLCSIWDIRFGSWDGACNFPYRILDFNSGSGCVAFELRPCTSTVLWPSKLYLMWGNQWYANTLSSSEAFYCSRWSMWNIVRSTQIPNPRSKDAWEAQDYFYPVNLQNRDLSQIPACKACE